VPACQLLAAIALVFRPHRKTRKERMTGRATALR